MENHGDSARLLSLGRICQNYRDVTQRRIGHQALYENKRLYEIQTAILDALTSDITLLDQKGNIISTNRAWKSTSGPKGLTGKTALVGANYLSICKKRSKQSRDFYSDIAAGIHAVLAGEKPLFTLEYQQGANQSLQWFTILVAHVGKKPVRGAVVLHLDITHLKRSEQMLKVSEERLHTIVENSGDAILTLRKDGIIETANGITASLFGYAKQGIIGRHISDLLPAMPFFKSIPGLSTPSFSKGDIMERQRNGGQFPADFVLARTNISDVNSLKDDFYVLNIRDTSNQRIMQEQLIQSSKLSVLGEMAAGMAHELNQPLSVMRMAAGNALLRLEKGIAEQDYITEVFELIESQAGKLGETILNLRVFAHREEQSGTHCFIPTEAVRAACQLLSGQVSLDSIDIIEDYSADISSLVQGSNIQFEQVVINLISNARDAILDRRMQLKRKRKNGKIYVSVREIPNKKKIEVAVQDNGGGIHETAIGKLFNPFFTTKEIGKGTGLGLSISYGTVTAMNGTIIAKNISGGARFEITLPIFSRAKTTPRALQTSN
jgi:PAS domain S-box-containing protein